MFTAHRQQVVNRARRGRILSNPRIAMPGLDYNGQYVDMNATCYLDGYLYGHISDGKVYRAPLTTLATAARADARALTITGYDFANTGSVARVHATPGGALLIEVKCKLAADDGDFRHFLFRSADGADTLGSYVLALGNYTGGALPGAHTGDIQLHNARSIINCRVKSSGVIKDAIIAFEYTGVNDSTNIWAHISLDDGATWAPWWKANDGANIWRHFHAGMQARYATDPDTGEGYLYAFLGDESTAGNACGIVRGPATDDWTDIDGLTGTQINAEISGKWSSADLDQKYRLIDVVEFGDGLLGSNDTTASSSFYRWAYDLSAVTEMDSSYTSYFNTNSLAGAGGALQLRAGGAFAFDYLPANAAWDELRVYATNTGDNWTQVATINLDNTLRANVRTCLDSFELPDGRVVLGGKFTRTINGGSPTNWRTPICQATKVFNGTVEALFA